MKLMISCLKNQCQKRSLLFGRLVDIGCCPVRWRRCDGTLSFGSSGLFGVIGWKVFGLKPWPLLLGSKGGLKEEASDPLLCLSSWFPIMFGPFWPKPEPALTSSPPPNSYFICTSLCCSPNTSSFLRLRFWVTGFEACLSRWRVVPFCSTTNINRDWVVLTTDEGYIR